MNDSRRDGPVLREGYRGISRDPGSLCCPIHHKNHRLSGRLNQFDRAPYGSQIMRRWPRGNKDQVRARDHKLNMRGARRMSFASLSEDGFGSRISGSSALCAPSV